MLSNLKLLILDVDGVLTDGTKFYDKNGSVSYKRFNDKDFTAIKRFGAAGVKVVWLSGDEIVNKEVARARNIDFYYSRGACGTLNKAKFIPKFEQLYGVKPDQMAFIGDDYFDLDIINLLSATFCPQDAITDIKEACQMTLTSKGGEGIVAELLEIYQGSNPPSDSEPSDVRAIDSKETIK